MNRAVATPLLTVLIFALVVTLAGMLFAPQDVWPNLLIAGVFLSGLGLSGGFVVAVHDASGGRWLGPVRGIAFSLTALVLPGSVIALAAIVFGGSMLYPAWHEHLHDGFKAWWLDRTFFTIRAFIYVAAWLLSMRLLRRGRPAAWLIVFAITVTFSTFDWMMSLDPHWPSTIMGVLRFSGLVTAGLAAMAIVAAARSRTDASITSDHIHDIAKLLFAFSTFWMYIWFSQAMLIWYTNMPEEASWYSVRGFGNWGVLMWATVALMWVVPFLVLLSEKAKRNRTVLLRVSVVVLIGHWLDLYVTIVPAHSPEPRVTGWDLAIALGAFAVVGWAATRRDATLANRLDAMVPSSAVRGELAA